MFLILYDLVLYINYILYVGLTVLLFVLDNRFFMFFNLIRFDVSQICYKYNLLFCLNSIFYSIRLNFP